MGRTTRIARWPTDLVRCPRCERGGIVPASPASEGVQCDRCGAAFPVTDGVIDLLPGVPITPSAAQRPMEWEAVVRIYESGWWRRSPRLRLVLGLSFEQEQELILQAANLRAGDTVLDLACGTGIYTRPFARTIAAGTAVGLDISLPMLRYASQRAGEENLGNLLLIHGTALELPFPPNRFDAVNCCGALHLFPDVPRVLGEIQRVLRPGGRFTVAAARRRSGAVAALGAALWRRILGVKYFTQDELASRLTAAGFEVVQCHHAKRIWLIMSARKTGGVTKRPGFRNAKVD